MVPGTPNSTAGMVSDVVVTAYNPIMKTILTMGSIVNARGRRRDNPVSPPKPGITPRISPIKRPLRK